MLWRLPATQINLKFNCYVAIGAAYIPTRERRHDLIRLKQE